MPNNDGENLDKAWASRAEAEAICDANWAVAETAYEKAEAAYKKAEAKADHCTWRDARSTRTAEDEVEVEAATVKARTAEAEA